MTFEDFQPIKMLGKGTFGKVFLVRNKKKGGLFAMKSIRKDTVINNEAIDNLKVEKLILL